VLTPEGGSQVKKTPEEINAEAQRLALAINELPLTVSQKTELGGGVDYLCWAAGSLAVAPIDSMLSAPLREHLDTLVRRRTEEGTLPLPIPTAAPAPGGFIDRAQPRD
jgi:hypothetical protein